MGGDRLLWALNVALVLAQCGAADAKSLEAALLIAALPRGRDTAEASACTEQIRTNFGKEVSSIVGALSAVGPDSREADLRGLPFKAKLFLLSQHCCNLKSLQIGGLTGEKTADLVRPVAGDAWHLRRALAGTYQCLETLLDEVFDGQVRLASGELVPLAEVAGINASRYPYSHP